MTTIELPSDVGQDLLLAANKKNKTVDDHIIFLVRGDAHLGDNFFLGENHPETKTTSTILGNKPRQPK